MAESKQLYERIKASVDEIRLIDTHEHLAAEAERNAKTVDLFSEFFTHYASSDLVSAGFPVEKLPWLRNPEVALDERWAAFAPYWDRMRHTAYSRSLLIAAKGLFGIDGINEKTYTELSAKITAANKPGWYRTVLKDKCRIDCSILDMDTTECDREFFRPVHRFNAIVSALSRTAFREAERQYDVTIRSLDTLAAALIGAMEKAAAKGIAGVKIGFAYDRPLRFDKVIKADAERVLNRVLSGVFDGDGYLDSRISWHEIRPLTDFLIHTLIETAERLGLPVQIHTGLHEGCGNHIVNSNPALLANLFFEYPKCRFDLFHGGYPYSRELATLAKNFQNVHVDMCWMHIMTPTACCSMLHEWLDLVPESKIFAFGGDYCFVEGVYGHAEMARENVARVLTERVVLGYMNEDEARALAVKLLRTNAAELFSIAL